MFYLNKLSKKQLRVFIDFALSSQTALILLVESILGIFLSISSLYLFIKLAKDVFESEFYFLDKLILQFLSTIRSPLLTEIMLLITFLGGPFLLMGAAFLVIVFTYKKHMKECLLFILTLSMGIITNIILKNLFERDRPTLSPLQSLTDYSFPSGHAMNSFIFYTLLAYFIYHLTRKKKLSFVISAFSLLLIMLIGFSRIYLGVHYPTDVLGGYLAGFFIFITMLAMKRTLKLFRLYKSHKNAAKLV